MFRGKESTNRIELSWLVQDLLNFGVLGSLQPWGRGVVGGGWMGWGWSGMGGWWGGWGAGGWGYPPHTCTRSYAHACMVNMIISCEWLPPLGESLGIPYDVIHMCMHVHVHVCVHGWGAPSHHPHSHPSIPHPRRTPRIIQNSIALELIEIFQFCLKIWNLWRLPVPWMGV